MAQGFNVMEVRKHQVVFREGEKGDAAYLLSEGEIEISTTSSGGKKVLALLRPVTLFGEMALILEEQRRTATATATEECRLVVFTRAEFEGHLANSSKIISSTVNVLVQRLKSVTAKSLTIPELPKGVMSVLRLLQRNGVETLSYADASLSLAEVFNMPESRVRTLLRSLAQQRLIEIRRGEASEEPVIRLATKRMKDEEVRKWAPGSD